MPVRAGARGNPDAIQTQIQTQDHLMASFRAIKPVVVGGDKVKAGGAFEHGEDAGLRRLIASGYVGPVEDKPKSKRRNAT